MTIKDIIRFFVRLARRNMDFFEEDDDAKEKLYKKIRKKEKREDKDSFID